MNGDALRASYEANPYPSLSFRETHPNRMGSIAVLLGMQPALPSSCRVLEIGCARGGNLIPMAVMYPNTEFVGIDFAEVQIKQGKSYIVELGASNIHLLPLDIRAVPAELGKFDYIIAHGIYSWVPADVREALLALVRRHLAPQGVAYVSYNVRPGWDLLGVIRKLMLFHGRNSETSEQLVERAKEIVDFAADAVPDAKKTFYGAYHNLLNAYRSYMEGSAKWEGQGLNLLLHDELEVVNDPFFFREFVDAAGQHGLQYLAEAEFQKVSPNDFSQEVQSKLMEYADDVFALEQYLDFLRNETLRRTLLVHEEVDVKRRMSPDLNLLNQLWLSSRSSVAETPGSIDETGVWEFQTPEGVTFKSSHPLTKMALQRLSEQAPVSVQLNDLIRQALESALEAGSFESDQESIAKETTTLVSNLLRAYMYDLNLVALSMTPDLFVLNPGEYPKASEMLLFGAAHGEYVVNQRHERVKLDPGISALYRYLDGKHSRDELVEILYHALNSAETDSDSGDEHELRKPPRSEIAADLEGILAWLGTAGLLVA